MAVLKANGCGHGAGQVARIATLPVEYVDGYKRALSNKGEVLKC